MRHRIKGTKLNIDSSHRMCLLANMASSLILHERIKTTITKAKMIRPFVEKLVTLGKSELLSVRRKVLSKVKNPIVADKLFKELGKRYMLRNGGYTRISKMGKRLGDNAEMAYISFV